MNEKESSYKSLVQWPWNISESEMPVPFNFFWKTIESAIQKMWDKNMKTHLKTFKVHFC